MNRLQLQMQPDGDMRLHSTLRRSIQELSTLFAEDSRTSRGEPRAVRCDRVCERKSTRPAMAAVVDSLGSPGRLAGVPAARVHGFAVRRFLRLTLSIVGRDDCAGCLSDSSIYCFACRAATRCRFSRTRLRPSPTEASLREAVRHTSLPHPRPDLSCQRG